MFIPDPDFFSSRIQGYKKAPDPGEKILTGSILGSKSLYKCKLWNLRFFNSVCCIVGTVLYRYCNSLIFQTKKPSKISAGDSVVKEEPEEVRNNSPQQHSEPQQLRESATPTSPQLGKAEFVGNNTQQHLSLERSDSNSPKLDLQQHEHVAVMADSGASPQQSGAKPKQKRRRAKRFCRRANCVKCTTLPCGICGPCRNPAKKSRCVLR